jgi:hypothetical protein
VLLEKDEMDGYAVEDIGAPFCNNAHVCTVVDCSEAGCIAKKGAGAPT